MNAQHTPGPWDWERKRSGAVAALTGGWKDVFRVEEYAGSAWIEISDADARLIAAVPELLAALQAGPSIEHTPQTAEGPCLCSQCEFVRLRRLAIAKATGSGS